MTISQNLSTQSNAGQRDPRQGDLPASQGYSAAGATSHPQAPAAQLVQRILDAEAQRLLRESEANPSQPTTGGNGDLGNGGTDDPPLRLKGEAIPVGQAHGERRGEAA